MIVRTGNSHSDRDRHDFGAAPGRRLTFPGIAETFGYEAVPGRLCRPEPEPDRAPSMSLGAQRMRAMRERQKAARA